MSPATECALGAKEELLLRFSTGSTPPGVSRPKFSLNLPWPSSLVPSGSLPPLVSRSSAFELGTGRSVAPWPHFCSSNTASILLCFRLCPLASSSPTDVSLSFCATLAAAVLPCAGRGPASCPIRPVLPPLWDEAHRCMCRPKISSGLLSPRSPSFPHWAWDVRPRLVAVRVSFHGAGQPAVRLQAQNNGGEVFGSEEEVGLVQAGVWWSMVAAQVSTLSNVMSSFIWSRFPHCISPLSWHAECPQGYEALMKLWL